jgi:hypothetical protein
MGTQAKSPVTPPESRTYGIPHFVLAIAIAVTVLQHVTMLYTLHYDGDEAVYSVLAKEMNWDLSHYTTQDDPEISSFPYTCYRHDLFFHPPLYPLVLKTGLAMEGWSVKSGFRDVLVRRFGISPARIGTRTPPEVALMAFAFTIVVRISALLVLGRGLKRWEVSSFASIVILIVLVICPITTFSTVRWHHDGLLGLLALIAFALLCESLQTGAVWVFTLGLMAALAAMNIRYNAIVLAPCFFAIPLYDAFRRWREAGTDDARPNWLRTVRSLPSWWWVFVAVATLALLTIGLSHFARVYARFGTLSPDAFNQPSIEAMASLPETQRTRLITFMERHSERTLAWSLSETILLVPVLFLLLRPSFWTGFMRKLMKGHEQGFLLLVAFFTAATVARYQASQVRYLAAAMPMIYLFLAIAIESLPTRPWQQGAIAVVLATHVFLATTSSFLGANFAGPHDQGQVIPAAYLYAPRLEPWIARNLGNFREEAPSGKSAEVDSREPTTSE